MSAPAFERSMYPMGLSEFKAFRSMIHRHTGIWLRDGRQVMLASRLSRRLRHHGMSGFAEYYQYIQSVQDNGDEIRELINCVTTNKTSFFRERHHFEFLADTVVPEAMAAAEQGGARILRVWCAASSTGEEPYTIAISLMEAFEATQRGIPAPEMQRRIQVVASDIDTRVLETARRGIYNADSLVSVAQPLQQKYFLRGKEEMRGKVKVKPEITRLVEFKRINLQDACWPLEGLFDVIFFRNALIYFNRDTQDKFLRRMVRYLKPRGYLFLGNSEHIPWMHDILEPLNKTMYRRRDAERG